MIDAATQVLVLQHQLAEANAELERTRLKLRGATRDVEIFRERVRAFEELAGIPTGSVLSRRNAPKVAEIYQIAATLLQTNLRALADKLYIAAEALHALPEGRGE